MTPTEIETAARRKYNSVGDTFWAQAEIMDLMYEAAQELAVECELIEGKDATASTVASTKAYDFPDLFIAVKRLEWNGSKLFKIEDRGADSLNLYNSAVTVTGNPQHYWIWNNQVYLEPTPASAQTLTFYGYKEHDAITVASTLAIPTIFHMGLTDAIVAEMCAKDENFSMAAYFMAKWEKTKSKAKRWKQKAKRTDSFANVIDEESRPASLIGAQ
jgi:DNA-binding transcriptional regulator/RsmH inhibitor MraZ